MKSFVQHSFDARNHRPRILPAELCYIRLLGTELTEDLQSFVAYCASKSSETYLSLPARAIEAQPLRERLAALGLKGLVLQYDYDPVKWQHLIGFGDYNSGDRDVLEHFQHIARPQLAGLDLCVELSVQPDTRILGPTIVNLCHSGVGFVVLNLEGPPDALRVRKCIELFEYLKIRQVTRTNVYFPFWNDKFREWSVRTFNTFSGLTDVHIDLSNRCTHSCTFCGLYSPTLQQQARDKNDGRLPADWTRIMSQEIDAETCFQIIKSVPWSVKMIQFGGMGDPLMHRNAVDFIYAVRARGFQAQILSNMEYLSEEQVHRLHEVGGEQEHDLNFIVNVSGGDAETYIRTRPRQTEKDFQKVKRNLRLFSELKQKSGGIGVHFTLMCVVTNLNAPKLDLLVDLALEVGTSTVWFKPVEVHGDYHRTCVPGDDVMPEMVAALSRAILKAKKHNIRIHDQHVVEAILTDYRVRTGAPA